MISWLSWEGYGRSSCLIAAVMERTHVIIFIKFVVVGRDFVLICVSECWYSRGFGGGGVAKQSRGVGINIVFINMIFLNVAMILSESAIVEGLAFKYYF